MSASISVSVDVDVDLSTIVEEVCTNCEEHVLLDALARENGHVANASGDETETAFALEAAQRLRDLAKWFRENQP